MASGNAVNPLNKQDEILRPLGDFAESIWADRFKSITVDKQAHDMQAKEIETLKKKVRSMLKVKERTRIEYLSLIDTVEQLGISYHFEKEIDQILAEIFHQSSANFEELPQNDLYATALHFRLLRQHGFNISSGVFDKFLNDDGKFKESLKSDIKGVLSLYEAAHVRTHGDTILEEALSFTTIHLKCEADQAMNTSLAKQVNHALEQSLHKGVPRIEARHYISVYEEDESKNTLLLRLAKLDFNLLQILHRQELAEVLRWCEDLEIVHKVPYLRARFVECYFLGLLVFFEPQYSFSRIIFAKTVIFVLIVDDTYDAYGTLDELRSFKDAVERWDVNEIDRLPEYMKSIYTSLLNFCEGLNEELAKQGRSYAFSKYKEEWKQYVRSSYTQSYWFFTRELPAFPDYLSNGLLSSAYYLLIPASFVVMKSGTEDVFNWVSEHPKSLVACAKMGRLINDVASHKIEKERSATAIDCYMNHYNVSEEKAMKKLEEIGGDDAWKDINEELLKPTTIPREILMRILNHARLMDVVYKHRNDGFTNPHLVIEPHIVAVLEDPIIV